MKLEKAYEPQKHEAKIYELWEKSGAFKPDLKSKKEPFSIIMPPPNANGDLHLGHAMYVVEDILIRYHRMLGHPTLWLPGADHAGIETQVVFEKELAKQNKSRFDLGREEFYRQALAFTKDNMGKMKSQIKSLGFSCDWSRFKFSLDQDILDTVDATFKQMYDDGLIYRGNRIVNWCTACHSNFADIEVKYRTQEDTMYTLDYGSLKIATTRPETIFADVAVAVNPDDKRYLKLIGQTATIPLADRPVKIIADDHVDPAAGTGALKVTPGHDPNDYEIGLHHDLPEISVIDFDGRMINVPSELAGLSVADARAKTVVMLKRAGKLVKATPLTHSVGIHDRCGTVIEPLITEQWWLRVESLVGPAIKGVETGQIKIVPKRFEKVYVDWLNNLHDWNISRQNWFGIRIPVFYGTSNDPDKDPYIIAFNENEAEKYFGKGNYRAETDTFDTWFSSGQWPFATLMATRDFDRFYPSSVMETGRDILFLWVTRMVMLGIYKTGKAPFKTVYLHGLVRDAEGQKMSKSKGNVINPLEVTDQHGTDALRLALTIGITPGNDGSLSEEKIIGYRNFCNKLWNVARFCLDKADSYSPTPPEPKSLADKWLLHRLQQTVKAVTKNLDGYRFSEAGQQVYSLLWDDFADWYIEASKTEANPSVLIYALETILKLAHPFAPYVTEVIWQNLPWQSHNLITSSWPEAGKGYAREADQFEALRELITETRSIKTELGLKELELLHNSKIIADNETLLQKLAGISGIRRDGGDGGLALASPLGARLNLEDKDVRRYQKNLEAKLQELQAYTGRLDQQLNNKSFIKSAPKEVIEAARHRYDEALMLKSKLDEQLSRLQH